MSTQSLWDSLPLRMSSFHSKNCTTDSDNGRIHPGPHTHVVNTDGSRSSGNPFLTAVRLALNECGLINECDTYDERLIAEYNNFDPERSLELLLERFSDGGAVQSPTAFINEMKTLVSWSNEGLKPEEVIQLEKKYGIQELGTKKDSLTYSRLRFLFPNFIGLTADGFYGENKFIPHMFGAPEFGGLIPSACSTRVCRNEIIAVHLCCLRLVYPQTSLKLHHLFLKKRIDGGLLSDEKRRHFLSGREIIKPDGKPTEKLRRVHATMCRLYSDLITEIKQDCQVLRRESIVQHRFKWRKSGVEPLLDPSLLAARRIIHVFPSRGQSEIDKSNARNYPCSQVAQIAITLVEGELNRMRDTQPMADLVNWQHSFLSI